MAIYLFIVALAIALYLVWRRGEGTRAMLRSHPIALGEHVICDKCERLVARYQFFEGKPVCANCRAF